MARVHFLAIIVWVCLILAITGMDNKESEVDSIVTKIVRRGLVPRRSLDDSREKMMKEPKEKPPKKPERGKPHKPEAINEETTPHSTSSDEPKNLQCLREEQNTTNTLIAYEEFKCKNKNNGEYLHNIEFSDGSRHKEEGLIVDGHFTIRGFFYSKSDLKNYHLYIKDHKGIHYFLVPITNTDDPLQVFSIDDGSEICSVRGDSCINPSVLASMIG